MYLPVWQRNVWIALSLCILTSCGISTREHLQASDPVDTRQVTLRGDVIQYVGVISPAFVDQVEALLRQNPAVTTLAIASQGGDVESGMRLGNLVKARSLDVNVIGNICASSCANYVFVSGKRKTIAPGAVVIWHGSPLRPEDIPVTQTIIDAQGNSTTTTYVGESLERYLRRPDVEAGVARDKQANMAFYRARGMNGRVTTFGQEVGCDCNWTLDVEDMAVFGISNVHAPDDYPQPEDWWVSGKLKQLELRDYPSYFATLAPYYPYRRPLRPARSGAEVVAQELQSVSNGEMP